MQVFMPYGSFSESVRCLDRSRLGNQVWREGKTLINGGWKHHPASKMFRGFEPALAEYCLHGMHQLLENRWIRPEKAHSLITYFQAVIRDAGGRIEYPTWFLDREVISRVCYSHQQNLLWKNPQFYAWYDWGPIPTVKPEYFWPV
jgi:hypothetical protein